MRKLYFSFIVTITGAIVTAGALVATGLEVAGISASGDYGRYYLTDSRVGIQFVYLGIIILLIGLGMSAYYAFKEKAE